MDCKQAQKMIPQYLGDELDNRATLRFLEHVEECPECMEELSIQYLVSEGTVRLEDGSSFDLNRELKNKIEHSRQDIKRQKKMNWVLYALEILAIVAVIFILVLVVFMR